jgi:hypothetical protein
MPLSVPATAPGTPVAPAVTPSHLGATVTITPPPDGGSPITAYTANVYLTYPPVLVTSQTQFVASNPNANVFTFTGLAGQPYGFTAIAINIDGPSGESPATITSPTSTYTVSRTVLAGTQQSTSFKSF